MKYGSQGGRLPVQEEILIQQTFSLGNFLGGPDGPDPQEAILGTLCASG